MIGSLVLFTFHINFVVVLILFYPPREWRGICLITHAICVLYVFTCRYPCLVSCWGLSLSRLNSCSLVKWVIRENESPEQEEAFFSQLFVFLSFRVFLIWIRSFFHEKSLLMKGCTVTSSELLSVSSLLMIMEDDDDGDLVYLLDKKDVSQWDFEGYEDRVSETQSCLHNTFFFISRMPSLFWSRPSCFRRPTHSCSIMKMILTMGRTAVRRL